MITDAVLLELGFEFREEVNDYVLTLSEKFRLRADIRKDRVSLVVQFNIIHGTVMAYDVVFIGVHGIIGLKKIIKAVDELIKHERRLEHEEVIKQMGYIE